MPDEGTDEAIHLGTTGDGAPGSPIGGGAPLCLGNTRLPELSDRRPEVLLQVFHEVS
jgi:hypothetical protein